jgi:hypothetical protein
MTLAPRVVHYTSSELVWVCDSLITCQCDDKTRNLFEYIDEFGNRHPRMLSATTCRPQDVPALWHSLVQGYSMRRLTYEKDIFPALSGLSQFLAKQRPGHYLAGLWEETLHDDLMWVRQHRNGERRPATWRAPTWSWASVIGPVQWLTWLKTERRHLASFRAVTQPAGIDPFGELISATLWITAPYVKMSLVPPEWHGIRGGLYGPKELRVFKESKEESQITNLFWAHLDYESKWTDAKSTSFQFLLISEIQRKGKSSSFVYGILLFCLDVENQVYERAGALEVELEGHSEDWLQHFDEPREFMVV